MKRQLLAGVSGLAVCAAGLSLFLSARPGAAQTRGERLEAATRRVKAALRREQFGADDDRRVLLAMARESLPDYDPALWHSGHVRVHNRWMTIDEAHEASQSDRRMTAYRAQRARHPDTVEGQLALARWCAGQNLPERQRAHLTRAVEIDPSNVEARTLLGYRLIGGQWMLEEDVVNARQQARQAAENLARWRPKIENIRRGLSRNGAALQASASKRLMAIDDPAAIGAIEAVLSAHNESTARIAVEALAGFSQPEASLALARQAAMSPWESVRDLAVEKLIPRDYHGFVPALLACLSPEIQTRMVLYEMPGGQMNFRHVFLRRGAVGDQVAVLDTGYRNDDPADRRLSSLDRRDIADDATQRARLRELQVERQNAMLRQLNARISRVLAGATGQDCNTPEEWWKWWNDYNEVFVVGDRPVATLYRRQEVLLVDPEDYQSEPNRGEVTGGGTIPTFRRTYECLVAGTPVWTDGGPMPVEQIRIGDLVLSQHPETGELAYKPVVRTTVRPAAPLLRIVLDEETVTASGGHPFWVAGEGWVKARELEPRQHLHGATGTAEVRAVQPADAEQTYNLVVADFHTYFVGDARILSHDNTIRRPVATLVPGLAKR